MPTPSDLRVALDRAKDATNLAGRYLAGDSDVQPEDVTAAIADFRAALSQPSGLRSDDPDTLRAAVLAYLRHMDLREPYSSEIKPGDDRHFDGDGCFAEMERAAFGEGSSGSMLDAAWAAAEAALPEGWGKLTWWPGFRDIPWTVEAQTQISTGRAGATRYRRDRGEGPTPAAALQALAARLRVPVAGDREP